MVGRVQAVPHRHLVHAGPAPQITHQIRRDTKQVIAPMRIVVVRDGRAQEAVIGFLQQVVGQPRIAGHAGEIRPHRPRRPIVEEAEGVLVHHEGRLGLCGITESLELGERQVTHGPQAY